MKKSPQPQSQTQSSTNEERKQAFSDRVAGMSHNQLAQASLRLVLKMLTKDQRSVKTLSADDIVDEMYKFISTEAVEREDPLISFFAHMVCSYYQVLGQAKNGHVHVDKLREQHDIMTKPKSSIVMPAASRRRH